MPEKPPRTVSLFEPERLAGLLNTGTLDAWLLQYEYMDWRRSQGLEPSRDRLNEWEQAWDELGSNLTPDRASC